MLGNSVPSQFAASARPASIAAPCALPVPLLLTLLLSLLMPPLARAAAADAAGPEWTFGGFGTLGLVHSSERYADYSANVVNPGGAGYTRSWDPAVDSRLGAQAAVAIDKNWSAVLQVISERNLQNSYRPVVEWANVKYQATPDLSVRVGRIALPIYLAGDYRKAGYALAWVRPPVELYGALPISNSDGVDVSYRWATGDVNNLTQVFYGHTDRNIASTGTSRAKASALTGLSNTTTWGPLTVRASGMTAKLTVDLAKPLFDAFRQFGAPGGRLADIYGLDNKRVSIANLGASYDTGAWFLMGEASRVRTSSFLGDKTAWYGSAGYRYRNLTPYLTYASVKADQATHDAGLPLAYLPPQAQPAAAYLNGQLNGLLDNISEQRSVSAGLRWDVARDYALKVQYDRLRPQGGTTGTLLHAQPGFQSGHPLHVLSLALDFVF